jgi:hypothetical protein
MLHFIRDASSQFVAALAFAVIFGAALLGFVAQRFLPNHNITGDSKDAAKLGAGLVATLAALMLGLLISSTKGTFDQVNSLINQVAANYIHLDRLLDDYGPQTAPIRADLRQALQAKLHGLWPEEESAAAAAPVPAETLFEHMANDISCLQPATAYQTQLQSSARQLAEDLLHECWLIKVIGEGSVPPLLLVIPVVWISFLTFLYALFSPPNVTTVTVLLVCALSIAGAIFLVDEMAGPLDGTIKVSSAPLRLALEELGR